MKLKGLTKIENIQRDEIFSRTFLCRWQLVTNLTSRKLASYFTKTFLSRDEAKVINPPNEICLKHVKMVYTHQYRLYVCTLRHFFLLRTHVTYSHIHHYHPFILSLYLYQAPPSFIYLILGRQMYHIMLHLQSQFLQSSPLRCSVSCVLHINRPVKKLSTMARSQIDQTRPDRSTNPPNL